MKNQTLKLGLLCALAASFIASAPLPAAAHPRTPTAKVQHPSFRPCGDRKLAEAGAECATLTVPLDYRRPGDRKIGIAISRIKAADPKQRRGILLFNPGGPGGAGLGFPARLRATLGDVAKRYDLIGFDPRFVGQSGQITCGPVLLSTAVRSAGLDRAGFDESRRATARFAQQCHDRNATILPFAGTPNVARDMDSIRAALGERQLSYYGVSYGADLGAMYSQLFPKRVDRMVIDSVSAVESEYELNRAGAARGEKALDEWAAWVAPRDATYHLGRTPAEVRTNVTALIEHAARTPIPVSSYAVDDNTLPFIIRNLLSEESNNAALGEALRSLTDIAAGGSLNPSPELSQYVQLLNAPDPELETYLASSFAVFCADRRWPTDAEQYWRNVQRSRAKEPIFGPLGNNIGPCAAWRDASNEKPVTVRNSVPIFMVQGLRDNSPIEEARDLHRRLAGSRMLTVDVRGHGMYGRALDGLRPIPCAERAVNNYLLTGLLPRHDYTCTPTP